MFRTLRRKIFRLAFVSGAGAAATYFLDRERGQERREQAKAKADSLLKRGDAGAGGGGGASWQPAQTANVFDSTPSSSSSPSPSMPVAGVPDAASAPTMTDVVTTPEREIDPLAPQSGPVSSL
jgi:hypothetical protein